jgi:hypothetical protein
MHKRCHHPITHVGRRTYFWFDWWTWRGPLRESFPLLFSCRDNPYITVAGVRYSEGWRIRFRRTFGVAEMVEWNNLCRILDLHSFDQERDEVTWALET